MHADALLDGEAKSQAGYGAPIEYMAELELVLRISFPALLGVAGRLWGLGQVAERD